MSTDPMPVTARWAQQIRDLGPTCDIATAARILGFGRTTAFELMRQGAFPVEVLSFGRIRRVRTADLLAYLHIPVVTSPESAPGPAPGERAA